MACARRRVSATSSTHRLVGAVNSAAVISRPAINPRGASVREVLLPRLSAKRGPVLTARLTPPVARRPPLLRKSLGRRHFSGYSPQRGRGALKTRREAARRWGCFCAVARGSRVNNRTNARHRLSSAGGGLARTRTNTYKYVSAPQQPRHYYPWTRERRAFTTGGYACAVPAVEPRRDIVQYVH